MKSSKFKFDLTDDLIITEENVQTIGERVALGSVRFLMRYSSAMLNQLYWELCEDVFRPHTIYRNISDAYDIAQEAICHLCNYIGRPFGDVIGTDKNGNPVTVRHDCFRIIIRYVAHHRTWMHRTFYLHDKIVADMTTDIETLIQHNDDIINDYVNRMKLKPTEEEIFHHLQKFVARVDEAVRLDEAHLLPIALEVFGELPLPVTTEYVPYKKNAKSKADVVARRLFFDSYYSFIITDFFEGLHYGHYPRQCEICESYFLMTSARRQRYCGGMSPYTFRGKQISCKQYAASINRKELAAADPVVDLYNRRCGAIRSEKSRGSITEEIAAKAKELALEHKLHAQEDPQYASTQYPLDMEREALYAEAAKYLI